MNQLNHTQLHFKKQFKVLLIGYITRVTITNKIHNTYIVKSWFKVLDNNGAKQRYTSLMGANC